jgi:hypothetical protein
MATVTGFTAEKMAEVEGSSVVNGYIDTNGHLILVERGGTEHDAGAIHTFLATETSPGGVELATNLETQQGVDNTRAVTPASLASLPGYRFWQRIKYTSSFTFEKAVYPGLKLMRVIAIGGGGGGGGAPAASTGNHSAGGGGGGGGYAERIIWPNEIADAVTISVGGGGAGGVSAPGGGGGTSSFGTLVVATGGLAGMAFGNNALMLAADAGGGGAGTAGDILAKGGPGQMGSGHATLGHGGGGGNSALGGGGTPVYGPGGASSLTGSPGGAYGGGAGGAAVNASGAAAPGGAGAPGIVIVELYV